MSHSEKTEEDNKLIFVAGDVDGEGDSSVDADKEYPDEVAKLLKQQLSTVSEKMDSNLSCDVNCGPEIDQLNFFTSTGSLKEHKIREKGVQGMGWQSFLEGVLRNRRSVVVGPFGSGKSTIAMQLVVQCNHLKTFCPIFFKFSEMNHEDKISFKQLLVEFRNPNLSKSDCESAFQWFVANQNKLLLILDACDEADWWFKMDRPAPISNYETPQHIWHLVGNLLNNHFFKDARKVFTSRYSSMLKLHRSFRPDVCYRVNNLTDENIQQIVCSHFQSSSVWSNMLSCGNKMVLLAGHPWFLQVILKKFKLDMNCTLTRWMGEIAQSMCTSSHTRFRDMDGKLYDIQKLASQVLESKSNWFGYELLKGVSLDMEAVQDLVVASPGTNHWNDSIVERNVQLRFFDPLLIDYFSACHVMSLDEDQFKQWLAKRQLSQHIRFIAGLLFDPQTGACEISRKHDIFVAFLKKNVKDDQDDISLLLLLEIVLEGGPLLSKNFASNFPSSLKWSNQLTRHQVKAICNWLEFTDVTVQQLILAGCDLDDEMFSLIVDASKKMHVKLNTIDISNNLLTNAEILCCLEFFKCIERTLIMAKCMRGDGKFSRSLNAQERSHMEAINSELSQPVGLHFDPENNGVQPFERTFSSDETVLKRLKPESFSDVQSPELDVDRKNDATGVEDLQGFFGEAQFTAKYEIGEHIADGTAGSKIHKCKGVDDGKPYVTKVLDTVLYDLSKAKAEAGLLFECKHENIVCYYNFCLGNPKTTAYIVMEMCFTSVYDYVKNEKYLDKEGTLHKTGAKDYLPINPLGMLMGAVKAVLFIHEKGFVHRDLKPHNFLLSLDGKTKVADFGFCRKLKRGASYRSASRGAENFLAPENYDGRFKQESDIYVLGLFFYFVLSKGEHPFGDENKRRYNMTQGLPPILDSLKKEHKEHFISVSSLIEAMLQKEIKPRPTIQMVENHIAFWGSEKKIDYLRDVYGFLEIKKNVTLHLNAQIGEYSARLLRDNDNNKEKFKISKDILPQSVFSDKNHPVKQCSNVTQFLKIIRDKKSHVNLTPQEMAEFGYNATDGWDKFADTFLSPVPQLLAHLYEVFREKKIPNHANYYPL